MDYLPVGKLGSQRAWRSMDDLEVSVVLSTAALQQMGSRWYSRGRGLVRWVANGKVLPSRYVIRFVRGKLMNAVTMARRTGTETCLAGCLILPAYEPNESAESEENDERADGHEDGDLQISTSTRLAEV